jgi:hypothetical protein
MAHTYVNAPGAASVGFRVPATAASLIGSAAFISWAGFSLSVSDLRKDSCCVAQVLVTSAEGLSGTAKMTFSGFSKRIYSSI